jgi:hypothetical protein
MNPKSQRTNIPMFFFWASPSISSVSGGVPLGLGHASHQECAGGGRRLQASLVAQEKLGVPVSYPKDPCMEYLPTLGLF